MAKYRAVQTAFWEDPKVIEEMTPEDKLFYLYLLTNPKASQIGIYQITRKQMAFEIGYSVESINALMERFEKHHRLIKYNLETREICLLNWAKYNLDNDSKPVLDCIKSEIQKVKDINYLLYIVKDIKKDKIKDIVLNYYELSTRSTSRITDSGQKEKEKEKEKEPVGTSGIKEFSTIYQNNIGVINSITATWLIELTETIDIGLFNKAVEICTEKGKLNQGYLKGIIKNWLDANITNFEQYKAHELQEKNSHGMSKTKNGEYVEPGEITTEQEQTAAKLLRECGIQVQ